MMGTEYDRCILIDNDRQNIQEWRKERLKKRRNCQNFTPFFFYTCNLSTLRVFFKGINFMVILQMVLACAAVYICKVYDIWIESDAALIVSPVVFPLAFAINTDFHRREKVLEYLGNFKSSSMICYFCMRDWKSACGLDDSWLTKIDEKLRNVLFNIRDYLLNSNTDKRKVIMGVIYEDFSDINQLFETIRSSNLPYNAPLMSRLIHLLKEMCGSFERLQVIREYRSSRTIRSFNKVMILLLPLILSPYFLYLGNKSGNEWSPYYIGMVVAFTFSALQGVQDKLDDPFDDMGEDDIDLDYFDEWIYRHLNSSSTSKEVQVIITQNNIDANGTTNSER